MTIEEFLRERVANYDVVDTTVRKWVIEMLDWHAQWPVFVETPTEFKPDFNTDFVDHIDGIKFSATKKIAFLTQEEYRKKFGDEPPAAPLLRIIACHYSHCEGFDEEWRIG